MTFNKLVLKIYGPSVSTMYLKFGILEYRTE